MKIEKAILATSYRDSHGDVLHPDGLKRMVTEINKSYLRVGVEHDPRIPPIGRITGAKLILLDDNECAVEGEIEIFEPGDVYPLVPDSKEMLTHKNEVNKIVIKYDSSYIDDDKMKIVSDLSNLLKSKPIEEIKKALEPLSILIVAGGFVLTSIAAGFFGKMGSDIYDLFKEKLKTLFPKDSIESNQEKLLIFEFTVYSDDNYINVNVILSNPREDDIELFLLDGIEKIDKILPNYYNIDMGLSEIYLKYEKKELSIIYGIRKDVIPIYPQA